MTEETKTPAVFDSTGELWEGMVDEMLTEPCHIIALRGAGLFNGIPYANADVIAYGRLIPKISEYLYKGRVSVIYDGDNDDFDYPDVGYIMGRLREHHYSFIRQVNWYAVQMASWYKYRNGLPALKPLHSANGNEYQTVVFPDKTFEGNHDHFSQHPRLVRSSSYEQWYVGACGLIASHQLADYSAKVAGIPGRHKATIFRAPVSVEQEEKILRKLTEEHDPVKIQRLKDSLERRRANPHGLLCTPDGTFISKPQYANLTIEVV
jgi:hypothetical protein